MAEPWSDELDDGFDRKPERVRFGIERGEPGEASFTLTQPLARFDGKLFGGTALGVAIALAEAETGRPAIWATVQFIDGSTTIGDRFDCTTEVLALGGSAAQVRVTGRVRGREVFCTLGATARPKEGRIEQAFPPFPEVLPPEESEVVGLPMPAALREMAEKQNRDIEMRAARPVDGVRRPGTPLMLWTRVPGQVATPAIQGYVADVVPVSIARAAGRTGGGSSLDNTIRCGRAVDTEWVLLEMLPDQAAGGYGHGSVRLWSPRGDLLGTASQSAGLILFEG